LHFNPALARNEGRGVDGDVVGEGVAGGGSGGENEGGSEFAVHDESFRSRLKTNPGMAGVYGASLFPASVSRRFVVARRPIDEEQMGGIGRRTRLVFVHTPLRGWQQSPAQALLQRAHDTPAPHLRR
jgi:hypothetical protein